KVTITNKRSGKKLGAAITLTLKGENPVIDRRAMDFSETKKKPKKKSEEEKEAEPEDEAPDPNSEEYWASGPSEAEADDSLPPPAHLQDKPGACGCALVGSPAKGGLSAFGLLSLLAVPLLRRRR